MTIRLSEGLAGTGRDMEGRRHLMLISRKLAEVFVANFCVVDPMKEKISVALNFDP